MVRSYIDKNGDGKPDEIIHFDYTDDMKTTTKFVDENADGKIDSTETFISNEQNYIKKCDDNADGKIDRVFIDQYDEEGNYLFTDDEAIAAFENFCTMYTDGSATKDSLNWGFSEMVDGFVGGMTGTLYNNTDEVPTLLEKMEESQWGVLPVPTAADGKVYNSTGSSYSCGVAANTKYPEEAKQLISFLCEPEHSMNYCKIAGMLPVRNDVGDNELYGEGGPYSGFLVQLDYPNLVYPAGYGAFDYTDLHQDAMHTEIQKYLLGQQSAADVLNNIGNELTARMKKYLADNEGATVEAPRLPKK
jgi:multiple sugar transport system substrate-binding protein